MSLLWADAQGNVRLHGPQGRAATVDVFEAWFAHHAQVGLDLCEVASHVC
jgi:hypothetical protein